MLGDKIKSIRIGLGMTLEEFGEMFEPQATKGTISKWENEKYLPNNERLKQIAEIGNTTVGELLNSSETKELTIDNMVKIFVIDLKLLNIHEKDKLYEVIYMLRTLIPPSK